MTNVVITSLFERRRDKNKGRFFLGSGCFFSRRLSKRMWWSHTHSPSLWRVRHVVNTAAPLRECEAIYKFLTFHFYFCGENTHWSANSRLNSRLVLCTLRAQIWHHKVGQTLCKYGMFFSLFSKNFHIAGQGQTSRENFYVNSGQRKMRNFVE